MSFAVNQTPVSPRQPASGFKEWCSAVQIAPRTEPLGLGGTFRVLRIIQSLGAPKIVEIFAFLVEGCPWIGRKAEHERLVAGMLPGPEMQLFGQVIVGAANIQDAESVLLDTPQRIIPSRSSCYNFRDLLRGEAVRSFYGC